MDIDTLFHRQLEVLHPDDIFEGVGIIGVGGIGSPTALALVKMGIPNIAFYDYDKVEAHNLPNQIYRVNDIGNTKVFALGNFLKEFAFEGQELLGVETKWNKDYCPIKDIMISAVDSMTTRKEIWELIKNNENCQLYIEARMGLEFIKIYAFNPSDPIAIREYEKTLYSSGEAVQLPCTARAILYNVFVVAGLIGSEVKKHLTGEQNTFEIVFDLSSMYLIANKL